MVVIGGGAAGLHTALKAAEAGASVVVIARKTLRESSSFWAQGGLAAAQDPQALLRMVATERAFAAATGELGVRDAFLVFFAADAVRIEAGATGADTILHDAAGNFREEPPQPLPLTARLACNPHTGRISM